MLIPKRQRLPCLGASLRMLSMGMSHEGPADHLMSHQEQSLHSPISHNLAGNHIQDSCKHLFCSLACPDLHPDLAAYASLLRWHGNLKDFLKVRLLHSHIIIHGLEKHRILERLLLQMYGKSGDAADALAVFARMHGSDPVSWNFVIGSCAKHGESTQAFQLFEQMQLEGCLPDKFMFASILSACSFEAGLPAGKRMHARITASGFECDLVVATALVNMYGKCSRLDHAQQTFDSIHEQDVVSWNAMITAYMQHGGGKDALQLYEMMHKEGVIPNEVTFVSVLSACANEAALIKGIQIHAQIVGVGLKLNIFMATALVNMYGKCGSTPDARQLFDGVFKEDVIIWNAMIAAYAQNGQGMDALEVFEQMKRAGVKPDKTTFVIILEACVSQAVLTEGKQMHASIKRNGYESDIMVGTALLNMYGKCSSLGEAHIVFDKLPNRNVVTWNALIASYALRAHESQALQLFEQMLCEGVIPDKVTFVNILPVCASHATVVECKRMHSCIANSELDSDASLGAGIVNMYGKSAKLEDAQTVFNTLPKLDISLWTALIAGYDQNGQHNDAIELFYQMLTEGIFPDKVAIVSIFTAFANQAILAGGMHMHACIAGSKLESEIDVQNALVTMYGKCGNLENARTMFCRMLERNAISWNGMIAVWTQLEHGEETIPVFWQMHREGVMPDNVTLVSILNLCGSYGALDEGSKIHACILHMGTSSELDDVVRIALMNMYASCGSLKDAWKIFNELSFKGVFSWTAMIEACAFHGEGSMALFLFNQMQQEGSAPNRVTLIKLLSACSHAGLLNEAYHVFGSMSQDPSILLIVDHYNCTVDLLGRVGRLDEAEELINMMPFPPNAMTWSIFLGACQMNNDVKGGEFVAMHIFELEPENAATYIMLSNIYAAAGRSDNENLENTMRGPGRPVNDTIFQLSTVRTHMHHPNY